MTDPLQRIIATAVELGYKRGLEDTAQTSGEVSHNKARALYGSWFVDAVKAGKVRPVRIGDGRTGKHSYRVADILTARLHDEARAELQLRK